MGANSMPIRSSLRQVMADVFISYSRKDSDFVVKLAAALKTAGRDVWVDVEGIRASEDWKQKIFREIDRANSFLFVVSPDSLQSEIANEEVSHAALNSKRMIPLFYRGLHEGTIPPALGRFQGIQFSDDALFPAGVSELLKTLATDIEWTDAHTRLLNRALEWEQKAKERSYLLRGSDLRDAEQMVAKSADREPKLTTLQSEYIVASRQSATKTQRVIIGAVVIAAVVALVLAGAALWQRGLARNNAAEAQHQKETANANAKKAEKNADEATKQAEIAKENQQHAEVSAQEATKQQRFAEKNARESRARELATYARESLGDDPEKSILLATQAVSVTRRHGEAPVPAAEDALHQAILSSQVLLTLRGHGSFVNSVAWSPDGKRLATASGDRTAKVWDAVTGKEVLTLHGHTDVVNSVAWSPDGKRLATASRDKTAKVWDVASGQGLLTLKGHEDAVHSVAWSPDGKRLATGSGDNTAKVWDATSGQESLTLRGHTNDVYSVAWSPDGKRLATGSFDNTAKVWGADSRRELLTLRGPTSGCAAWPGARMASGWRRGVLTIRRRCGTQPAPAGRSC
jgi:DNA-binding beta-propeller fold protein YncE